MTTADGIGTLYGAARAGDIALLQRMLQSGASVDECGPGGRFALNAAADNSHVSIRPPEGPQGTQSTSPSGNPARARAPAYCARGDLTFRSFAQFDVCKLLLAYNANPDTADGTTLATPLHMAAESGDAALAKLLLEQGARPDEKEAEGDTPLHIATAAGCVPLVRLLLDYSADPCQQNQRKQTALDLAAESGTQGEFIRRGFNLSEPSSRGAPPDAAAARTRASYVAFSPDEPAPATRGRDYAAFAPDPAGLPSGAPPTVVWGGPGGAGFEPGGAGRDSCVDAGGGGAEHGQGAVKVSGAAAAPEARPLWYAASSLAGTNGFRPKENQDAFIMMPCVGGDPAVYLFGVMDGHGRHGHHVAQFVKHSLAKCFTVQGLVLRQPDGSPDAHAARTLLATACDTVQGLVADLDGPESPPFPGAPPDGVDVSMSGCTLVLAMIVDGTIFVANVGDSRCVLGSAARDGVECAPSPRAAPCRAAPRADAAAARARAVGAGSRRWRCRKTTCRSALRSARASRLPGASCGAERCQAAASRARGASTARRVVRGLPCRAQSGTARRTASAWRTRRTSRSARSAGRTACCSSRRTACGTCSPTSRRCASSRRSRAAARRTRRARAGSSAPSRAARGSVARRASTTYRVSSCSSRTTARRRSGRRPPSSEPRPRPRPRPRSLRRRRRRRRTTPRSLRVRSGRPQPPCCKPRARPHRLLRPHRLQRQDSPRPPAHIGSADRGRRRARAQDDVARRSFRADLLAPSRRATQGGVEPGVPLPAQGDSIRRSRSQHERARAQNPLEELLADLGIDLGLPDLDLGLGFGGGGGAGGGGAGGGASEGERRTGQGDECVVQ